MENLIGKVGMCSINRPGLITERKEMPWGMAWVGDGLDRKGPWASRNPRIVADSLAEWEAVKALHQEPSK